MAERAAEEINTVLADLGLTRYRVDSLVLEPIERDIQSGERPQRAIQPIEGRGVTMMLRESGSDRAAGYLL